MFNPAVRLKSLYILSGILTVFLCHSGFYKNTPEGPLGFYIQLFLLGFPSSILPFVGFSFISEIIGGLGENTVMGFLQTFTILILGYLQWFYFFPFVFRRIRFFQNLKKSDQMKKIWYWVVILILTFFLFNAILGIMMGLKVS